MSKYRTAQGKIVDMAQLAAKNEKTRAVGNMKVNARGDTIDSTGKIVVPVNKKVGDGYQKIIANRAANLVKKKNTIQQPAIQPDVTSVVETIETVETETHDLTEEELAALAELDEIDGEFEIKSADDAPDFVDPTETSTKQTKNNKK